MQDNRSQTMTATFKLNGKTYTTDPETLDVLRSVMGRARATSDYSAVVAMMALGKKTGRIVESR